MARVGHLLVAVLVCFFSVKNCPAASDVDECLGSNRCHETWATCHNYFGGYFCTCNSGYAGNGYTCSDVDECSRNEDNCHALADCKNLIGSFECDCKTGYAGDGVSSCIEITSSGHTTMNSDTPTTAQPTGEFTTSIASTKVDTTTITDSTATTERALESCQPTCDDVNSHCVDGMCVCKPGFGAKFNTCTALCAELNTSSTNLEFGTAFINELAFSKTVCPEGDEKDRPIGLILCSATSDPSVSAAFDATTLTQLDCNVTLARFLNQVTWGDVDQKGVENRTSNLILLTNEKSILTNDETESIVQFFSNLSNVVSENRSGINFHILNNVIQTANVIANSSHIGNITNGRDLGTSVVQSLRNIASHVTIEDESISIETENVAVTIFVQRPGEVGYDNTVHNLNVTSHLTTSEAGNIFLPSEVFHMAANGDNDQIQTVLFVFKGDDFFESEDQVAWILTAVVGDNVTIENLTKPITISLTQVNATSGEYNIEGSLQELKTESRCVFWDKKAKKWSSKGMCRVKGTTTCHSTHLTSFSVLVKQTKIFGEVVLSQVTTIGCILSLFGLFITIVVHLYVKKVRDIRQTKVFVHICSVLVIFYLTFLLGINRTNVKYVCTALAAFMHYILLSAWCWMAVYIHCVYNSLTEIFSKRSNVYMTKALLFGYGFPLIAVGATIGVSFRLKEFRQTEVEEKLCGEPLETPDMSHTQYRSDRMCWLHKNALTYGFVLPCALIFLFNLSIYILVMYKILRRKIQMKAKAGIKRELVIGATMAGTLGFTWIFGYLMLTSSDRYFQSIMSWLFAVTSSTQGLLIFALTVLRRAELRDVWCNPIRKTILDPAKRLVGRVVSGVPRRTGIYNINNTRTSSTDNIVSAGDSGGHSTSVTAGDKVEYSSQHDIVKIKGRSSIFGTVRVKMINDRKKT